MDQRVDLFEQIRRDRQREGTSVRELARRYGVHRQKVRQALADAVPPPRKPYVREAPTKLDPAKRVVDAMLLADLEAPRKQRHTVRRILARLIDEHEISELTYSNVRNYCAPRRPEILAEAGKLSDNAFVPQTHEPGAEAEVDFADLWVILASVLTKCFLFTFRLRCSGKAVHRVFASQGQESFLEGHLHVTAAHDAFWAAARVAHGDAVGTRALVEALLLHRHMSHADVVAGLEAAASVGATTAEVVAIEARRAEDKRKAEGSPIPPPPQPPARSDRVASLTERRLIKARDELPPDGRSLPSVERYDELLTRPRSGTEGGKP